MPKRFTDTEKWRDEWWGSLPNDYRMIWLYLVDSCSIAGIWKKDFRGLAFNCNVKINEDEFKNVFGDRLIDRGNYFFIPKFLRFQYQKGLNSNKPAIISVVKELENNNLIQIVIESLGNDFLIIKDKDKDKDKRKDKDKDKDKEQYKEYGVKNGFHVSIKKKYANDTIQVIHKLEDYFKSTDQLDGLQAARFDRFEEFMKLHPAAVFEDGNHLYNSFIKFCREYSAQKGRIDLTNL